MGGRTFTPAELAYLKRQFLDTLSAETLQFIGEAATSAAAEAKALALASVQAADSGRVLDFSGATSVRVPAPVAASDAATLGFVEASLAGQASELYVGSAISAAVSGLVTAVQMSAAIAAAVAGLATEAYADGLIVGLATEGYVDGKFTEGKTASLVVDDEGVATTLSFTNGLLTGVAT